MEGHDRTEVSWGYAQIIHPKWDFHGFSTRNHPAIGVPPVLEPHTQSPHLVDGGGDAVAALVIDVVKVTHLRHPASATAPCDVWERNW